MKPFFVAGFIALLTGQAAALSCMQPDPVAAFERAAASDVTYYVLYGALDFEAPKPPKTVEINPQEPDPIPATFRGNGLSKTGFDLRFDSAVTVQPRCAGSWCGQVMPHVPSLIFAQVKATEVLVEVGPCGGQIFGNPSEAVLSAMTACINGQCPSGAPLQ